MTDLRKAAEMALERLESHEYWMDEKAIQALRQALAQSEQEPEWLDDGFGTMWQKCGKKDCGKFVVKIGKVDCWNGDCPETTAPQKREWVGLTDEELLITYGWIPAPEAPDWILNGAKEELLGALRKVEAKLKEKNGG